MVVLALSRRLYSGRSPRSFCSFSSGLLPQLLGKFAPAIENPPDFPKLPLGSFPQAHPGSLPAAMSPMNLGGGSGGGGNSGLEFGIAIGVPGDLEIEVPADRLVEPLRPWLLPL